MISDQTNSIYLPRGSTNSQTNDSGDLTNNDVASTSMSPSPHGFDIDTPNVYRDEDLKIIDKIELYCREVISVGRDAKHHNNPKVLKYSINNQVGEKCVFLVIFLGSSIKSINANEPNHEGKRREERQANLSEHAKKKRTRPRCCCGFSLN